MVPAQPAGSHSMPPMRCMDQSQSMSMTLIGEPLTAFPEESAWHIGMLEAPGTMSGRTAAAHASLTRMARAMARGMQAMAYICRHQAC